MKQLFATAGVIIICALCAGCSSQEPPRTPKEFVEQYSRAWQQEDVEAILAMQARKTFADQTVPDGITIPVEEYWFQREREGVETSIRNRDLFARAWEQTVYQKERVHGDHIHVDILVAGIRSSIVLVRHGDTLKIHPDPSSFP